MVKSVIDDITTYYPTLAYQVKTDGTYTNTRKYYSFNGAVVAMRENGVTTWLLQDQVNSATITADANGNLLSETRYSAFGEVRYSNGTMVTDKLYTGQQQETEIGLDYYIARFYDPVIAHFIQPDSLIPQAGASASYDRYAYVNGNPVNFNDPTGNYACADFDENGKCIPETKNKDTAPIKYIGNVPVTDKRDPALPALLKSGETPDLTYWLLETMQKNAKSGTVVAIADNLKKAPSDQVALSLWAWAVTVGYGGRWDYKVELESAHIKNIRLGINIVDYQDLANIHYGYVGKAAAIPDSLLHVGAGGAAIAREWQETKTITNLINYWATFGDEPKDYGAIDIGIYLYNAQKGNGGVLTVEMLNDAYQLIRGQ